MRAEPVVLLSFVQEYLQRADAHRKQGDPDVVQFHSRSLEPAQTRRIFDQPKDKP